MLRVGSLYDDWIKVYVRNIKERLCNVKNTWIVTNEIYDTPACKCYFKHKEMGLFFVTDHFDLNNLQKNPAHVIAEKVGFQLVLSSDPIEVSVLVRSYWTQTSFLSISSIRISSDTNFKYMNPAEYVTN